MANIKSQKKRIITNEKARMRNRAVRSELKTATRAVKDAVEAKDGRQLSKPPIKHAACSTVPLPRALCIRIRLPTARAAS